MSTYISEKKYSSIAIEGTILKMSSGDISVAADGSIIMTEHTRSYEHLCSGDVMFINLLLKNKRLSVSQIYTFFKEHQSHASQSEYQYLEKDGDTHVPS